MWYNSRIDMMSEFLRITYKMVCKSCKETIPVNGPVLSVECARCGQANAIPERNYYQYISLLDTFPEMVAKGTRANFSTFESDSVAVLKLEDPLCRGCGTPLPTDSVPVGETGTVTCACGETHHSEPPPVWLEELEPRVVQSLGATMAGDGGSGSGLSAEARVRGSGPVVMTCPVCSGPLAVMAGTERTIACEHCANRAEIPEVLWGWLHPLPRAYPWYLRIAQSEEETEEESLPEDRRWIIGVVIVVLVLAAVGLYLGFGI